ncbi:PssE/Cps14G family polysaccharide biosynthesis glycosyltransferase [Pseudoalteromonas mariniglutinosa]|uniref:PssE/Cps14G family polysaccharide biosynthesis glycosyltransferase n=1 Tax=Pseudoalteromonas mariniglutinosa TaxID=206042 RepID=UPI00384D5E61
MRFFVTVGNTRFDSLFKTLDVIAKKSQHEFIGQIADGSYTPKNFETFTFSQDISRYIADADAVISHAGAGSVFRLLENHKKLIVVFNTDRVDEHQKDLASFVESELFALTCWDLSTLENLIKQLSVFTPKPYIKDDFHETAHIIDYLFD